MERLDLRKIPCPRNSSKALIFLTMLERGELVEIYLDDGEPIDNVPSSLEIEGHKIISKNKDQLGFWIIVVEAK